MTTFYAFHRWLEPNSTTDTVVLAFGGWWDADVGGGSSVSPIIKSKLVGNGSLVSSGLLG